MRQNNYSDKEISILVADVQDYKPIFGLMKRLGRTPSSITAKIRELYFDGMLEKKIMGFYHNEKHVLNKDAKCLFFNADKLKKRDTKELKLEFGKKLKKLIYNSGVNQNYIARELDVSRQSVSQWVVGFDLPTKEKSEELIDLLGTSAKKLFNEFFKKY